MIVELPRRNWWVYLAECGDGSLYCGIARDVETRMRDHATSKGSRYVRSHGGIAKVLWRIETPSRSSAQVLEAWIKRQNRQTKLALACGFPVFGKFPLRQNPAMNEPGISRPC